MSSTDKRLEDLHLPFSVVLGKSYLIYCKENPKPSLFSPKQTMGKNAKSEFLFIFPMPNTLM